MIQYIEWACWILLALAAVFTSLVIMTRNVLIARDCEWIDWCFDNGIDLDQTPPPGLFYRRQS